MMWVSKVSVDIHDVTNCSAPKGSRNSKIIRNPLCELLPHDFACPRSKRFSCKQERLLTFDTYVILYSEYANCQNGPAADVPLPNSPTGKYRMHEGAEEDS